MSADRKLMASCASEEVLCSGDNCTNDTSLRCFEVWSHAPCSLVCFRGGGGGDGVPGLACHTASQNQEWRSLAKAAWVCTAAVLPRVTPSWLGCSLSGGLPLRPWIFPGAHPPPPPHVRCTQSRTRRRVVAPSRRPTPPLPPSRERACVGADTRWRRLLTRHPPCSLTHTHAERRW